MNIFIISSVRDADVNFRNKLERYTESIEKEGHIVHLPHRDTNQSARGYDICYQNMNAIKSADEVHIFFNTESKGSHFDMGVSFALGKKIVIVENESLTEEKSFQRMLTEWEETL